MNQRARRSQFEAEHNGATSTIVSPISKSESVNSEDWIGVNYSQSIGSEISKATESFKIENGIEMVVTNEPIDRSISSWETSFKYIGKVQEHFDGMSSGENLTAVLAYEEGVLIGCGLVENSDSGSKVEIIDVDLYSRRSNDFSKGVQVSDQELTVGVGHAVVLAIVGHCKKPIIVDATHASSRYVFKSFGFTHDDSTKNPCILKLE